MQLGTTTDVASRADLAHLRFAELLGPAGARLEVHYRRACQ